MIEQAISGMDVTKVHNLAVSWSLDEHQTFKLGSCKLAIYLRTTDTRAAQDITGLDIPHVSPLAWQSFVAKLQPKESTGIIQLALRCFGPAKDEDFDVNFLVDSVLLAPDTVDYSYGIALPKN